MDWAGSLVCSVSDSQRSWDPERVGRVSNMPEQGPPSGTARQGGRLQNNSCVLRWPTSSRFASALLALRCGVSGQTAGLGVALSALTFDARSAAC
jgi:hypothetical protein